MKKRERFISFLERILGIKRTAPSARVIIIPDDIRNSIKHSGDPRMYDAHHSFVSSFESLFPRQSGQQAMAETRDSRTALTSADNAWNATTLNQVLEQTRAHTQPAASAMPTTSDRLDRIVAFLWDRKISVAIGIYVLLTVAFLILYIFGLVPEVLKAGNFRDFNISDLRLSVEPNSTITVQATTTTADTGVAPMAHASSTRPAIAPATTTKKIAPQSSVRPAAVTKPVPVAATLPVMNGENPVYVESLSVGLSVKVTNPASADNATLEEYLKKGGIRYPGSFGLGAGGNTLLMGHSTSYKVVNNQAYKAFNGVKLLKVGDIVTVRSLTKEYRYRVTSNIMAKNSEVYVDFTQGKNMITLVTCNVLGAKEDRYVVTADLVETVGLQ